jgi:energy-coupling factor transport system permease protein
VHALAGSEDIIDAMDLRAFGTGPRTWLIELRYQTRDYILIGTGAALFLVSMAASLLGLGQFWVPPSLLRYLGF